LSDEFDDADTLPEMAKGLPGGGGLISWSWDINSSNQEDGHGVYTSSWYKSGDVFHKPVTGILISLRSCTASVTQCWERPFTGRHHGAHRLRQTNAASTLERSKLFSFPWSG
jgi:hypothetical protein